MRSRSCVDRRRRRAWREAVVADDEGADMSRESPSAEERDALIRGAHYDRALLRARRRSSVIAALFTCACVAGIALSLTVPLYRGWGEAAILGALAIVLLTIGAAAAWLFRHQAHMSARLGIENIGELVEFARHAEQRESARRALGVGVDDAPSRSGELSLTGERRGRLARAPDEGTGQPHTREDAS